MWKYFTLTHQAPFWCTVAVVAGMRSSKPKYNWSKKMWRRDGVAWVSGRGY